MAPQPPGGTAKGRVASRFPVYQIDFTAVASGKYIATSKRRIRWRFGFSNKEALENGETGTACRGEEHDITVVWSVTSGKRLILADGQEVHYSNNRSSIFDFSWTMRGNHVLKVVMHAAPSISATPGFRQYDLLVDGQSFFNMPKVFELGIRGTIAAHAPVPGVIDRHEANAGYRTYDLTRGEYVKAQPRTAAEEEADLQKAIQASLEESKAHLNRQNTASTAVVPAPAPASYHTPSPHQTSAPVPAPSPAPARGALYREASEFKLVSKEAKANESDLLDLLGDWNGTPTPAPISAPAPSMGVPNYTSQPADTFSGHATDDPFAPKPIQDIPPAQPSFNVLSQSIMSQYGPSDPAPAPSTMPNNESYDQGSYGVPSHVSGDQAAETSPISEVSNQPKLSMNDQFTVPDEPTAGMDSAFSKLVNINNINEPAEAPVKLSMNSNPFAEQQQKSEIVKGKVKSKGIPPKAAGWAGPQPSLSEMKSIKPQSGTKPATSVMNTPNALVVSNQQNGNYGGYAQPQAGNYNQGAPPMGGYGQQPQYQQGQYQQQPMYQQPGQYQQQPGQYQQQPGQYQQQSQQGYSNTQYRY